MKKFIVLTFFFALIFSCKKENTNSVLKEISGYNIAGNYKQFDNQKIYLQKQILDKSFINIDSTTVQNNSFNFKGKKANSELHFIGFETNINKIPVILDNFETVINITNQIDFTVKGSEIQNEYTSYLTKFNVAKNKFLLQLNYIKEHPNSLISVIVLKQMLGKTKWRLAQNKKAFNYLSDKNKQTEQGKYINTFLVENEPLVINEVEVEEISLDPKIENPKPIIKPIVKNEIPKQIIPKKVIPKKAVIRREKAPNFFAESQDGTDVSLNKIRKNAKVTLIDFWASWCAPCRQTNPHLVKLYNKYHSKGFEIVGVSEDKYLDINLWKNAILVDGLPWHQIIDDDNRVANMFNVKSIPHTVLLDKDGGIIFAKKTSYTIEQKLIEIFGF